MLNFRFIFQNQLANRNNAIHTKIFMCVTVITHLQMRSSSTTSSNTKIWYLLTVWRKSRENNYETFFFFTTTEEVYQVSYVFQNYIFLTFRRFRKYHQNRCTVVEVLVICWFCHFQACLVGLTKMSIYLKRLG